MDWANITLGQLAEQHTLYLIGLGLLTMLGFCGFFGWRYRAMKTENRLMRADIEALKQNNRKQAAVQVIIGSISTYNDFKGANGKFHLHVDGKVEIISTKPLPLRIKGTFDGFTARANLAPPKKEIEKVSDE